MFLNFSSNLLLRLSVTPSVLFSLMMPRIIPVGRELNNFNRACLYFTLWLGKA